jgi:hypothetical protein
MNNPDHFTESLETIFGLKYIIDADPAAGIEKFGSGINIPDPQRCYFCTDPDPGPPIIGQKK